MEVSRNSVANRRLYLMNQTTVADFSAEEQAFIPFIGEGAAEWSVEAIRPDIVSTGAFALRVLADEKEGKACHSVTFGLRFPKLTDLSSCPTLTFAFSAYDGERDSQFFKNTKENMYFVEKPDPLLVSKSYVTVELVSKAGSAKRTVFLTDYGFNRVFVNFAGETFLGSVEEIRFTYDIEEEVPQWQRVMYLDTVTAGFEVDFTCKGSGMEQLFSGKQASVLHRDGRIELNFGENGTVVFPSLKNAKDTVCDVFLPVKNTVLMRLESDTDEMEMTFGFRNDAGEQGTKKFALSGLRGGKTCFFNLSDCPEARGRLTEFSLSPHRACSLTVRKVSFEEEFAIREFSGEFTSCTVLPEEKTILISGRVRPEYVGQKLRIYDVYPDIVDFVPDETLLAAEPSVSADGSFSAGIPLYRGKVTRIVSQFLAIVGTDEKFTEFKERTCVSNREAICTPNPYEFRLPDRIFDVTDPAFGAKGDGYTDDTRSIQAAIDACSASGGGRVLIPGAENGGYGRRYVITNLLMKSLVDLHLEKNAILWQSDDPGHYERLPFYGHNVSMTGINWPANHTSGNYPLIYGFRLNHIKITGKGTIRMCDTESYSRDGRFTFIGDNVCIGCCDRMHVCPLGITECESIELSDFTIIRSSAPYLSVNVNKKGYYARLNLLESKCTGADGMWPCGSDGIVITGIMLNNNDDGLCLSANYNDPRDILWSYSYPGFDRGTHNIELSHSRFSCYTFTASAISFCTWGTDSPELDRAEVNGIKIFDTVLEGRVAMGGWTDNPYYGVTPFDCSEKDDFSPVKDITVLDCELRSPLGIEPLRITNFVNDFGFRSPSQFEYGNFTRRPAEQNPGWTCGLSNWSFNHKESVRQIDLYGVNCAMIYPRAPGENNLWQGLFLDKGTYRMTFRYKCTGTFDAFAADQDGNRFAGETHTGVPGAFRKGSEWFDCELVFENPEDRLVRLGVASFKERTIGLYVTDFSVEKIN